MNSSTAPPIRCLVAKVGLDGHDRGAHVVSRAFRDAGFEVIYSGLHNEPMDIVSAAIQEDVDVVGISILSGAHNTHVPKILEGLADAGIQDQVVVIVGGVIPDSDAKSLKEQGVDAVFGPGTPIQETIEFVTDAVTEQR